MSANSFFLSFYYINLVQTLQKYKLFLILQSKYIPLTRVRDKDCVKNRVKRAKIVRFTLC